MPVQGKGTKIRDLLVSEIVEKTAPSCQPSVQRGFIALPRSGAILVPRMGHMILHQAPRKVIRGIDPPRN